MSLCNCHCMKYTNYTRFASEVIFCKRAVSSSIFLGWIFFEKKNERGMGERVLLRFFKQNSEKSNSEKPNGSFSNISQMFLKYSNKDNNNDNNKDTRHLSIHCHYLLRTQYWQQKAKPTRTH